MAELRLWLLEAAQVSPHRIDRLLALLDKEEVDTVEDLAVFSRTAHFTSRLTGTTALKIKDALAAPRADAERLPSAEPGTRQARGSSCCLNMSQVDEIWAAIQHLKAVSVEAEFTTHGATLIYKKRGTGTGGDWYCFPAGARHPCS